VIIDGAGKNINTTSQFFAGGECYGISTLVVGGDSAQTLVFAFPQGLNVMYQDVVYIDASQSEPVGYGKGGKLKSAFHFPTTPATATSMDLPMLHVCGAKAPLFRCDVHWHG
jgi:hypothetical protein